MTLQQQLLDYHMDYRRETDSASDKKESDATRYCFTPLLHKHRRYYGDLVDAYSTPTTWPPEG